MNLKELYQKFIDLEEKLDLFSYKFNGMYIWERIRFTVFGEIKVALGLTGQAHTLKRFKEVKTFEKLKFLFLLIKDSMFHNPFYIKGVDFLFIGHPRRKLMDDGLYWDIYTDPIVNKMVDYKTATVEGYHSLSHFTPVKTKRLYYTGIINLIARLKAIIYRDRPNLEIEKFSKMLKQRIKDEFGVDLNIENSIVKILANRQFVLLYKKLFKKMRLQAIFVICSYGKENIIEAAKQLKIPVVELQHGVINRYHLGYSYENSWPKQSFPDYFFPFGEFWLDNIDLPIPENKIFPIGYPYIDNFLKNYRKASKQNTIIFISQGTIGKKLSQFAVKTAEIFKGQAEVIYKLHPGECEKWKKNYSCLVQAEKRKIVKVIEGDKPNLYELFSCSRWVVGVSSTAIYEAMAFNCTPFIVNLFGSEYMEALVKNKFAKLINEPEEIDLSFKPATINKEYFFADDWQLRFKKAISQIMKNTE
ncbi:MAG: hypothetical protein U9O59_07390 [Actinomycetota bacterium]|nr:hypothetical protein [Actinomycetota bacterium]